MGASSTHSIHVLSLFPSTPPIDCLDATKAKPCSCRDNRPLPLRTSLAPLAQERVHPPSSNVSSSRTTTASSEEVVSQHPERTHSQTHRRSPRCLASAPHPHPHVELAVKNASGTPWTNVAVLSTTKAPPTHPPSSTHFSSIVAGAPLRAARVLVPRSARLLRPLSRRPALPVPTRSRWTLPALSNHTAATVRGAAHRRAHR